MNKLTIPSILAATVLIAGIFAFMPVEKASTVHTSLGDKIDDVQTDVDAIKADVSTIKDDIGELELGELTANRVLTLTDNTVADDDIYTLACTDTVYRLMRVNANITEVTVGDGARATFTLSQADNGFAGVIDLTDAGDDDLTGTSIGMLTTEDIMITVTGTTTVDNAVVKATIQLPQSVSCTLTETTA